MRKIKSIKDTLDCDEADLFAHYLLMPDKEFKRIIKRGIPYAAAYFGVSEERVRERQLIYKNDKKMVNRLRGSLW